MGADVALLNAEHRKNRIEGGARSAKGSEVGTIAETDRSQRQQAEERQPHAGEQVLFKEESTVVWGKLEITS